MAKLPSMQMYPGDWLKDPALRLCSTAARGVWADMLMLMFESPERGVLRVKNGSVLHPIAIKNIAKSIQGAREKDVRELITNGVAKVARKDGAIYSKRLVRDELKRRHKAQAGSKGGKQTPSKPEANTQAKRGSSSSTSSSASTSREETAETTTPLPPSDVPLEVGGVGPPPGRKYQPHTVSVELIAKVRGLVDGWKGKPLPLPPEDSNLGQLILEKMLKDGKCQAADIMAADIDDLKAAEKICRDMQKADWKKSGKGAAGWETWFGLGHLKLALGEKKQRGWEQTKKADAAEAEQDTPAQRLLKLKTIADEAEQWKQWRALSLAERRKLITEHHNEEKAMRQWWLSAAGGKGQSDEH